MKLSERIDIFNKVERSMTEWLIHSKRVEEENERLKAENSNLEKSEEDMRNNYLKAECKYIDEIKALRARVECLKINVDEYSAENAELKQALGDWNIAYHPGVG